MFLNAKKKLCLLLGVGFLGTTVNLYNNAAKSLEVLSEETLKIKMNQMGLKVPDAKPVYGCSSDKKTDSEPLKKEKVKPLSYGVDIQTLHNQMEKMGLDIQN